MTQFLPPNLLALFAAREPLRYLAPAQKLPHEKKRIQYGGVAEYLEHFEDPEDTPPPTKILTKQEKLEIKRREKAEQNQYKLEQQMALWNPTDNKEATTDPFKTLFVARINYDTSESKLRREFETYGKIKQIKMVHDKDTGKPRGYAFIEYETEADMRSAYKRADGKKIDNRRVLVDVERGRTIAGWKPRRLGGDKGGRKSRNPGGSAAADSSMNNGSDSKRAPSLDTSIVVDEGRRDKDRDRDRERRDRGHDRGEKERGDRDRERDRGDRGDVKRSEDRPKRKSRSRSKDKDKEKRKRSKSKDRHRSRSKERSKKSRRSRSRDRNISTSQSANTAVPAN